MPTRLYRFSASPVYCNKEFILFGIVICFAIVKLTSKLAMKKYMNYAIGIYLYGFGIRRDDTLIRIYFLLSSPGV